LTNFNPVLFWAPAVLLVPAALAAAYFYFSLKVELTLLARHSVTRAELAMRWKEVVTEVETLRVRLAAVEARPALQESLQEWTPRDATPQPLNLNRRGQILRLHAKGRSAAEIASDLQISQGEVELLVKVHDWSPATTL
jgi:DNA-binding NarL/FixJ family response regulator